MIVCCSFANFSNIINIFRNKSISEWLLSLTQQTCTRAWRRSDGWEPSKLSYLRDMPKSLSRRAVILLVVWRRRLCYFWPFSSSVNFHISFPFTIGEQTARLSSRLTSSHRSGMNGEGGSEARNFTYLQSAFVSSNALEEIDGFTRLVRCVVQGWDERT